MLEPRVQVADSRVSARGSASSEGRRRYSGRHVCIVTETCVPEINGVALTLARLAEGLTGLGHRVSIVRPRRPEDDPAGLDGMTVTGLPLPGYPNLQAGAPAGMALRRHWRRDPPDAVYVATEGPLGWSAVSAARRLQLPVLSGFHTHFDSYSEHYGAGWLQPAVESYLRLFHNRTLATLVPTSDLRRRLASLGLRNLGILGRGVDSSRFDPALRSPELRRSWGAADDSLVLLYVGRLAPEKNLALAVAAYRELRRSRDAVRFVLIGDGPARAALERANPDLTFCGMQTGQALARGYASADIFLFPSETETFGNVTLEAMASGLAVVAYDYAAAHMHIAHGWTGVRVPFGKSRLFIDATVQLGRNPRLVGDLRRRAREYATTVDWASVVKRFETLLLTNDWRRPPREVDLDGISKLAVLARDVPPA